VKESLITNNYCDIMVSAFQPLRLWQFHASRRIAATTTSFGSHLLALFFILLSSLHFQKCKQRQFIWIEAG
jgi:hypothetical protein